MTRNKQKRPKAWIPRRDGKQICRLCRRPRRADGADPCLGRLPGVVNACCGHGVEGGHIIFSTGIAILFDVQLASKLTGSSAELRRLLALPHTKAHEDKVQACLARGDRIIRAPLAEED
jgi:hypothetical protein